MKKTSYNTLSRPELMAELATLKASIQASVSKMQSGKNSKEYVAARKNVARVLTAMNALPAEITTTPTSHLPSEELRGAGSTKSEK